MPNRPLTNKAGKQLVLLVVLLMVLQLGFVSYGFFRFYDSRSDLVDAQRGACERAKKDRKDNAAFQNAHTKYITKVTGAKSVKEDVKSAAREAVKTFRRTSSSLQDRSEIDCIVEFPTPGLFR